MNRELDARVARAMGLCPHIWELYEPETTYCKECGEQLSGPDPFDDYPNKRCRDCGKEVRGLRYHVGGQPDCKPYSTDIAAAWQVVEWMKAHGYTYSLAGQEDGSVGMWFGKPEWFTDDLYQSRTLPAGRALIAPEAICLAFLAAVEGKL